MPSSNWATITRRRLWRLLLPLVFGMAFIVAPQPYYEALGQGIIEPGFISFMSQYLAFQDFPGEAWRGEDIATSMIGVAVYA